MLAYTWRCFCAHKQGLFFSKLSVLVVGTGKNAEVIRGIVQRPNSHYELVGFVQEGAQVQAPEVPADQIVGDMSKLRALVAGRKVHCVVMTSDSVAPELAPTITQLKFEGVRLCLATDFSMRIAEELPVELLTDSWLWFAEGFDLLQAQLARKIKRLGDLLLATSGLLLTLPLSLLTALAGSVLI